MFLSTGPLRMPVVPCAGTREKRQEGNIINITSGAGLRGLPGSAAYAASKAAIVALSYSLADELRDQGIE